MNKIADALSRLPEDAKNAELKHFQVPRYIENEEFILPLQPTINDQMTDNTTARTNSIPDSDDRNPSEDSEQESWTLYSVEFETPDATETPAETNKTINQHPAQVNVITEPATRISACIKERREQGLVKSYAPRRPTDERNISDSDRRNNGATTQQRTDRKGKRKSTSQTTTGRDNNETAAEINTRSDDNEMTKNGNDHITNDDTLDSEVDVTITTENADAELTDDKIYQQMSVPQFTAADYLADPFSKQPITIYRMTCSPEMNRLTGKHFC